MWDLLRDARKALAVQYMWRRGSGDFANTLYCVYCSFSRQHGHGQTCIITRLNKAFDSPDINQPDHPQRAADAAEGET